MGYTFDINTLRELRQRGGDLLRERREYLGLTQRELAARVGLEPYTIVAQLERGIGRIEPQHYASWSKALELPLFQFVGRVLEHTDPVAHRLFVVSGAGHWPSLGTTS